MVVERNGVKFGPQRWVFSVYRILGKLNASGNFEVIRCISDFQKPCVSKTAGFRVKDTSRSLCYPVYVVIVFHLVKQSAKPLGFLFTFVSFFLQLLSPFLPSGLLFCFTSSLFFVLLTFCFFLFPLVVPSSFKCILYFFPSSLPALRLSVAALIWLLSNVYTQSRLINNKFTW